MFLTLPEFDISGRIRVYGDQIDIGPYEWNPWSSPANENEIDDITSDLICYPNPAYPAYMRSSQLNIWWKNSTRQQIKEAEIEIYNLKGQKVESIDIDADKGQTTLSTTWDVCNKFGYPVSTGIYILRLRADGEYIAQQNIMVVN